MEAELFETQVENRTLREFAEALKRENVLFRMRDSRDLELYPNILEEDYQVWKAYRDERQWKRDLRVGRSDIAFLHNVLSRNRIREATKLKVLSEEFDELDRDVGRYSLKKDKSLQGALNKMEDWLVDNLSVALGAMLFPNSRSRLALFSSGFSSR